MNDMKKLENELTEWEQKRVKTLNKISMKVLAIKLIEWGVPFSFGNDIITVKNIFSSTEWYAMANDGKLFVYGDFCYSESGEEEITVDELIDRLRLYYK